MKTCPHFLFLQTKNCYSRVCVCIFSRSIFCIDYKCCFAFLVRTVEAVLRERKSGEKRGRCWEKKRSRQKNKKRRSRKKVTNEGGESPPCFLFFTPPSGSPPSPWTQLPQIHLLQQKLQQKPPQPQPQPHAPCSASAPSPRSSPPRSSFAKSSRPGR